MDVTQHDSVQNVVQNLPEVFQNITVLINNAGLALGMELAQFCSLDNWQQMIDTKY